MRIFPVYYVFLLNVHVKKNVIFDPVNQIVSEMSRTCCLSSDIQPVTLYSATVVVNNELSAVFQNKEYTGRIVLNDGVQGCDFTYLHVWNPNMPRFCEWKAEVGSIDMYE